MSFVFKSTNLNLKEAFMKAGNSVIAVNANGVRDNSSVRRNGFSMIELVFVIVILGVLAAVAVPRFVATRTDAQVATARSDMASVQKAIVAKVFADNIDATASKPTDPNKPWGQAGAQTMTWGEWIMQVGGLDGGRWATVTKGTTLSNITIKDNNGIEAIGNVSGANKSGRGGCGMLLGIDAGGGSGAMVFDPSKMSNDSVGGSERDSSFCQVFKKSYNSSAGVGNKIVPLATSGTVEF